MIREDIFIVIKIQGKCVICTLHVDGLALLGARASAGIIMTKFIYEYMNKIIYICIYEYKYFMDQLLTCNCLYDFLEKTQTCICISYNFLSMRWLMWLKCYLMEDKSLFILHHQWHCCWWPGTVMSHGISSHGIILVPVQHPNLDSTRAPSQYKRPSFQVWGFPC